MASPNNNPIYSIAGDIEGSAILTLAANDYTGQGANNITVHQTGLVNGGFIQRLRFKALGTNVASVARIFINNGKLRPATTLAAVVGTPTGTPATTGGTLQAGNYFAKIYAVDQWGGTTANSTESAAVAVTGTTGSIAWAWAAVVGAVSYWILVGPATGQQTTMFTSSTNSYSQVAPGTPNYESDFTNNNYFYGEVTLPATTIIATTSTVDIDYPMNFPLPPGFGIVVGLGTAVAAGWHVCTIGGSY